MLAKRYEYPVPDFVDPLAVPLIAYKDIFSCLQRGVDLRMLKDIMEHWKHIQCPLQLAGSQRCGLICFYIAHCFCSKKFPFMPDVNRLQLPVFVKPHGLKVNWNLLLFKTSASTQKNIYFLIENWGTIFTKNELTKPFHSNFENLSRNFARSCSNYWWRQSFFTGEKWKLVLSHIYIRVVYFWQIHNGNM